MSMYSLTVQQTDPEFSVGTDLQDKLCDLASKGFEVVAIHETKIPNPHPDCDSQGFIVIYKKEE